MIKKTNGYIEKYRDEIQKGNTVAGIEIITILDKLLLDMNDPRYIYDTGEADRRMNFMEHCIRLTKSPFYGKLMKLMLWQKAFISAIYGLKMANSGEDRFKKILLLVARKNTKSELCSALALTELILGEAGGDICCSSNDDSQASILMEALDTMRLMIDPLQKDTWRNQRGIRNKITNSKAWKLSERTRNKEGRNISFAISDEIHELKDNTIVKSIEQSQSLKLNPKLIFISTEGFTNDGFLDNELIRARKILNGEDDGTASERYLPFIFSQDCEQEVWQDERSWEKSNPSIGIVKKLNYLREQVDLARRSKAERMFVLAKDFNIKQNNAEAWLQESDYNYDSTFDIEDFKNSLCLGAVDLAETTDLCCAKALLMRPDDKTKYILSRYWIPESKLEESHDKENGAKYSEWAKDGLLTITQGNDIDLSLVADWFYKLYEDYRIRPYKIGYDQRFAKDFLKRSDEYGFDTEMIWQNAQTLSNAAKLVEADLKDQLISYNNNPIDKWCFGNASIKVDNYGQILLIKIDGQKSRRIDGAVTTVILFEVLRRYRSEFLAANCR